MIKTDTGEILELKEGVVINEDGSQASRSSSTTWLFGLKPGGVMTGVLAAFAIPLVLFFGLIFLGGFLSIAALILLFQPFARRSSGTDIDPHSSR